MDKKDLSNKESNLMEKARKRILRGVLTVGLAATALELIKTKFIEPNEEVKLFIGSSDDEDIKVYGKDGTEGTILGDTIIFEDSSLKKEKGKYGVVGTDKEGNAVSGYLDESDITLIGKIEKEKLSQYDCFINVFGKKVNVRNDTIIADDTLIGVAYKNEVMIASSKKISGNEHNWYPVLRYDEEKGEIVEGYVVEDYVKQIEDIDTFFDEYEGKKVDYDGAYGAQCVDFIKYYAIEVLGCDLGTIGNAHVFFDEYSSKPTLVENFDLLHNTPDFVPEKGDIVVFGSNYSQNHNAGHIAIATGEGNENYFYSYDQNNPGAIRKVKHEYSREDFLGVLRPKKRENINLNFEDFKNKILQEKSGFDFEDIKSKILDFYSNSKDSSQEENKDDAKAQTSDTLSKSELEEVLKNYTVKSSGKVVGIDISSMSAEELERYLSGKKEIPSKAKSASNITYSDMSCYAGKPDYVYIKLGATNHRKIEYTEGEDMDIDPLAKICEKYKVPYGFYFYSASITEDEMEKELARIENKLSTLESTKYNLLPFAVDREIDKNKEKDRQNGHKDEVTALTAEMIKRLREKHNVILYSGAEATSSEGILDIEELQILLEDEPVNMWYSGYMNSDAKTYGKSNRKALNRLDSQINIKIVQNIGDLLDYETEESLELDLDICDPEVYEELIKDGYEKKKSLKKHTIWDIFSSSSREKMDHEGKTLLSNDKDMERV